jgi:hypothetical protein
MDTGIVIIENLSDVSNCDISPNTNKIEIKNTETFIDISNISLNKIKNLNNLNHITLEYFSNIGLYNKINKTDIESSINKSDKKFYRKRIINETKKMLKDEFENDVTREMFNKYIFSLINHFKMVDTTEALQKEFLDKDEDDNIQIISNETQEDISQNYIIVDEIVDCDDINITDVSNSNPDNLLFKQKDCKILTMDNFIKKKNKQKEKVIFPLKKHINLRDPELKTKGIQKKQKKENIDNV